MRNTGWTNKLLTQSHFSSQNQSGRLNNNYVDAKIKGDISHG